MDPDIVLLIIWKRWRKWKKMKQTLQQRKVGKRHILKLFAIWKLIIEEGKAHDRMWMRPIFRERQRFLQGASDNLVREMEFEDHEMFYNYCRISTEIFH